MSLHKEHLAVLITLLAALFIIGFSAEITGMAYSRSLGRTETSVSPALLGCSANDDCPAGYACRPYGALQRIRVRAKTGCVPICEDPERNRLPYDIIETLKAQYDLNRINGFDPFKVRPTRFRPKHSYETFLYTSNCKDATTLVEPFCLDATRDDAQAASIEVPCTSINSAFSCLEDDNGDASCGYPDDEEDKRLFPDSVQSAPDEMPEEDSGEYGESEDTEDEEEANENEEAKDEDEEEANENEEEALDEGE